MHIEQAETCPLRGNELGAGRFHMTAGGYEMCPKAADAVDWLYDPWMVPIISPKAATNATVVGTANDPQREAKITCQPNIYVTRTCCPLIRADRRWRMTESTAGEASQIPTFILPISERARARSFGLQPIRA